MNDRREGPGNKGSAKSARSHRESDIFVFAFFLLLSFAFWYLNGLSNEIENQIRYPVRYVNPPRDRLLISNMPSRLGMTLRGPGYSLLKLRFSGSRAPLIIDLSKLNYRLLPDSDPESYFILTSSLTDQIHRQMRADFSILEILPDTLVFMFDRLGSKKVPVVADVEVVTDKDFFVSDKIGTDPDSIVITGPWPVIDSVKAVKTKNKKYTGISRSFSRVVQLEGARDYSISERKVSVVVPVEQFTEASLDLPVKLINKPDSLEIKLFPDEVNVRLLVAVSDYNAVLESNIQAVIDVGAVKIEGLEKLPVTIINVPRFARSLRYSPQEIDYLLERRK